MFLILVLLFPLFFSQLVSEHLIALSKMNCNPLFLFLLFLFQGFTIFVREESGSWREIPVSSDSRFYQLRDLLCGTKYQIYVSAHNEAGTGLPSNTVATRTHGTGQ